MRHKVSVKSRKRRARRRLMTSQQPIHSFNKELLTKTNRLSILVTLYAGGLSVLPNFAIANRHLSCTVILTLPTPKPQHSHLTDSLNRLKCLRSNVGWPPWPWHQRKQCSSVLERVRQQQAFVSRSFPVEPALVMHLPLDVMFHTRPWGSIRRHGEDHEAGLEKLSRKAQELEVSSKNDLEME